MLTTSHRRRLARVVAAVAVSALVLTACGSAGDTAAGQSGRVTLAGAYGEVTVPVTDQKIWALDPSTATELLQVGVRPTHSGRFTHQGDAAFEARHDLLAKEGVTLVEPGKLELVVQARPALIIGAQSLSSDELVEELKKIAPVFVVKGSVTWKETLSQLGRATGHDKQAEAIIKHLGQRTAAVRADLDKAGYTGETVSLMSACGAGSFCAYGSGRSAGPLLAELGFTRPAAHGQDRSGTEYGYTMVSEEKLGDLVAPIVFVLTGSVQYGAPDPLGNPLFKVGDAKVGKVDFGAWYGASSFDVPWILADIRAVLLGDGEITGRKGGSAYFDELKKAAA
ncbi:ABC transporter substrate-binding protein [Streptosporangium sp. NPDC006007]|uniref:ABC transporter substrate-binding protein n=1 Tax=Streptosporangium sp. NPDC006007 TaxID=3154575 RepID=UPI0033BC71C8